MKKAIFLGVGLGFLALVGCSTMRTIPGAPPPEGTTTALETKQSRSITGTQAVPRVIHLSDQNPMKTLEEEIASIRTEKVIIPTRVLRTLVANQKAASGQCKDLSLQLEALKNIDLEETENGSTEQSK